MSSQEHKQKIWGFIEDIKIGMLTTQDGEELRARPMHIVQDEYDGTLWFFTKASSHKVDETKDKHHVCVTFTDKEVQVSLSGYAVLTRDPQLIDKFWNPYAGAWFENGRDDPEVALLEIKITHGEHWKEESKIKELYEVAKANLVDGETPDMGENEKFG